MPATSKLISPARGCRGPKSRMPRSRRGRSQAYSVSAFSWAYTFSMPSVGQVVDGRPEGDEVCDVRGAGLELRRGLGPLRAGEVGLGDHRSRRSRWAPSPPGAPSCPRGSRCRWARASCARRRRSSPHPSLPRSPACAEPPARRPPRPSPHLVRLGDHLLHRVEGAQHVGGAGEGHEAHVPLRQQPVVVLLVQGAVGQQLNILDLRARSPGRPAARAGGWSGAPCPR